ncbi:hypothetical protein [Mycoplasma procyoni]|uniref:hypothetical protein n=1 Tax=Mycoplasma procyoni TaxID=568784 RepID=UPI00197C46EB|nr:hypothetical protein [Mycoplasma procyoni]MBN3534644.1 hypothetical protein [Mycoplasma procyoni]
MAKKLLLGLAAAAFSASAITAIILWIRNSKNPAQEYNNYKQRLQDRINAKTNEKEKAKFQAKLDAIGDYSEDNLKKLAELEKELNNIESLDFNKQQTKKDIDKLSDQYNKKQQLQDQLNNALTIDQISDIQAKAIVAKLIEEALPNIKTEDKKAEFVALYNSADTNSYDQLKDLYAKILGAIDSEDALLKEARDKANQRLEYISDPAKRQELKDKLDAAIDKMAVDQVRQQIEDQINEQKLTPYKKEAESLNKNIKDPAKKEEFAKKIEEAKTKDQIEAIKKEIIDNLKQTLSDKELLDAQKKALVDKVVSSNLQDPERSNLIAEINGAENSDQLKNTSDKINIALGLAEAVDSANAEIKKLADPQKQKELQDKIDQIKKSDKTTAEKVAEIKKVEAEAKATVDAAKQKAQEAIDKLKESGSKEINDKVNNLEESKNLSFSQEHFEEIAKKAKEILDQEIKKAQDALAEVTELTKDVQVDSQNPFESKINELKEQLKKEPLSIKDINDVVTKANEIKKQKEALDYIDQKLPNTSQQLKDALKKEIIDNNTIDQTKQKADEVAQTIEKIKEKSQVVDAAELKDDALNTLISSKTTPDEISALLDQVVTKAKEEIKEKINALQQDPNNPSSSAKLEELKTTVDSFNNQTPNQTINDLKQTIENFKSAKEAAVSALENVLNPVAKTNFKEEIKQANTEEELKNIKNKIDAYNTQYAAVSDLINSQNNSDSAKEKLKQQLNSDANDTLEELQDFAKKLEALEQKKQQTQALKENAGDVDFTQADKNAFDNRIKDATTIEELDQITKEIQNPVDSLAKLKNDQKGLIDASDLHSADAKNKLKALVDVVANKQQLQDLKAKIQALETKKTELNTELDNARTENKLSEAQKNALKNKVLDATLEQPDATKPNEKDLAAVKTEAETIKTKFDEIKKMLDKNDPTFIGNSNDSVLNEFKARAEAASTETALNNLKTTLENLKTRKAEAKAIIDTIGDQGVKETYKNELEAAKSTTEVAGVKNRAQIYKDLETKINSLDQNETAKNALKQKLNEARSSANPDAIQLLGIDISRLDEATKAVLNKISSLENTSDAAKEELKNQAKGFTTAAEVNDLSSRLDAIDRLKKEAVSKKNELSDENQKTNYNTEIQNAKDQATVQDIINRIQRQLDANKSLQDLKNALKQEIDQFASSKNPAAMSDRVRDALKTRVDAATTNDAITGNNGLRAEFNNKKNEILKALATIDSISYSDNAAKEAIKTALKEKLKGDDIDEISEIQKINALALAKKDTLTLIDRLANKNDKLNQLKTANTVDEVNRVKQAATQTLQDAHSNAQKAIERLTGSSTGLQNTLRTDLQNAGSNYTEAKMNDIINRSNTEFDPKKQEVERLINAIPEPNEFKSALRTEFETKNANGTQTIGSLNDFKNKVELIKKKQEALNVISKLKADQQQDRANRVRNSNSASEVDGIKNDAQRVLDTAKTAANSAVEKINGDSQYNTLKAKITANATQAELEKAKSDAEAIYNRELQAAKNAVNELTHYPSANAKYTELNNKLTQSNQAHQRDTVAKLKEIAQQARAAKEKAIRDAKIAAAEVAVKTLPERAGISNTTRQRLLEELNRAKTNLSSPTNARIDEIAALAKQLKPKMDEALVEVDKLSAGTPKNNALAAVLGAQTIQPIENEKQSAINTLNAERTKAQSEVNKTVGLDIDPYDDNYPNRRPGKTHEELKAELARATTQDQLKEAYRLAKQETDWELGLAQNKIDRLGSNEAKAPFIQRKNAWTTVQSLRDLRRDINDLLAAKASATTEINKLSNSNTKRAQLLDAINKASTTAAINAKKQEAITELNNKKQEALASVHKAQGHAQYQTLLNAVNAQNVNEDELNRNKNLAEGYYNTAKNEAQGRVNEVNTVNGEKYRELNSKLNDANRENERNTIAKLNAIKNEAVSFGVVKVAKDVVNTLPSETVNGLNAGETKKGAWLTELNNANITVQRANEIKNKAEQIKAPLEQAIRVIKEKQTDDNTKNDSLKKVLKSDDVNAINAEKTKAENSFNTLKNTIVNTLLPKAVGLTRDNGETVVSSTYTELQNQLSSATTAQQLKDVQNKINTEFEAEKRKVQDEINKLSDQSAKSRFNSDKDSAQNVQQLRAIKAKIKQYMADSGKKEQFKREAETYLNKIENQSLKNSYRERLNDPSISAEETENLKFEIITKTLMLNRIVRPVSANNSLGSGISLNPKDSINIFAINELIRNPQATGVATLTRQQVQEAILKQEKIEREDLERNKDQLPNVYGAEWNSWSANNARSESLFKGYLAIKLQQARDTAPQPDPSNFNIFDTSSYKQPFENEENEIKNLHNEKNPEKKFYEILDRLEKAINNSESPLAKFKKEIKDKLIRDADIQSTEFGLGNRGKGNPEGILWVPKTVLDDFLSDYKFDQARTQYEVLKIVDTYMKTISFPQRQIKGLIGNINSFQNSAALGFSTMSEDGKRRNDEWFRKYGTGGGGTGLSAIPLYNIRRFDEISFKTVSKSYLETFDQYNLDTKRPEKILEVSGLQAFKNRVIDWIFSPNNTYFQDGKNIDTKLLLIRDLAAVRNEDFKNSFFEYYRESRTQKIYIPLELK